MTTDHKSDAAPDQDAAGEIARPAHVAGSGGLDRLVGTARDYARAAASDNTLRAYAADWAHFSRWCRLKGAEPLPPSPEMVGLYLADLAAPEGGRPALSVGTIERRLSGLGLCAARHHLGPERPPHRRRSGRDPPPARPTAGAEGGDPAGGYPRDAGYAAFRPARAA